MPQLIIDRTDIGRWLRLQREDGFDPIGPDKLAPQFGEIGVGEGAPLLSVSENNREVAAPVHLSVQGDISELINLVPEPGFMGIAAGVAPALWTRSGSATSTTFLVSGSNVGIGSKALHYAGTLAAGASDVAAVGQSTDQDSVNLMPVNEGDTYIAQAWAYNASGFLQGNVRLRLEFFNSTGAQVGSDNDSSLMIGGGTQTFLSVSGVVPTGARTAKVSIVVTNTGGVSDGFDLYLSGFALYKASAVQFVGDGDCPGWEWDGTPWQSASRRVHGANWIRGSAVVDSEIDTSTVPAGWTEDGDIQMRSVLAPDGLPAFRIEQRWESAAIANERVYQRTLTDEGGGIHWRRFAGQQITFSVDLYVDVDEVSLLDGCTDALIGIAETGGSSDTVAVSGGALPARTWRRLSVTHTVIAAPTDFRPAIYNTLAAGIIYARNPRLEVGTENRVLTGDDLNGDWLGSVGKSLQVEYRGKDGLHLAIAKLNRVLADADRGRMLDNGARHATHLDVEFGRFEADYNFWRSMRLWCSGTVRLFCRPYGHTGSLRIAATRAGSGVVLPVSIGPVIGDADARLDLRIRGGSRILHEGAMAAVAVVPSGWVSDIPAASLTLGPSSALIGATHVIGSQVVRSAAWNEQTRMLSWTMARGSVAYDRVRVLALAAAGAASQPPRLRAHDLMTNRVIGDSHPTAIFGKGVGVVDFGVMTVPREAATLSIGIDAFDEVAWLFSGEPNLLYVNRLLLLPEDLSSIADDRDRTPLYAYTPSPDLNGSYPASRAFTTDSLGRDFDFLNVFEGSTGGFDIGVFSLPSQAEVAYGTSAQPDTGLIGRVSGKPNGTRGFGIGRARSSGMVGAFYIPQGAGVGAFSIGWIQSTIVASTFASIAAFASNVLNIEVELVRDGAQARLYSATQMIATLIATSSTHLGRFGLDRPALFLSANIGLGHFTFDQVPARTDAAREWIELTATGANKLTGSQAFRYGVTRPGVAPDIEPSLASGARILALALPDHAPSNDLLDAEVRIQERFTYQRP